MTHYRLPGPRLACRTEPRVLKLSRWDRAASALYDVLVVGAGIWFSLQMVFGGLW